MNDEPTPEGLTCSRCETPLANEDNFCRHCGLALNGRHLPSVRNGAALPATWQPSLPSTVVKGAAVVAAGTLAQRLARGLVRRAFRRSQPKRERAPAELVTRDDALPGDGQVVSETFFMRRIRIRR